MLRWLGPNLTSHSTPNEQANHHVHVYMYVDEYIKFNEEVRQMYTPKAASNKKKLIYMYMYLRRMFFALK